MTMLDLDVLQGYIRMCADGWQQGWHERNGGNLTYRMTAEEAAQAKPFFKAQPGAWVRLGVQADNLKNEYFIATGSGKFLRNVPLCPQDNMCGGWKRAAAPPASSPAIFSTTACARRRRTARAA